MFNEKRSHADAAITTLERQKKVCARVAPRWQWAFPFCWRIWPPSDVYTKIHQKEDRSHVLRFPCLPHPSACAMLFCDVYLLNSGVPEVVSFTADSFFWVNPFGHAWSINSQITIMTFAAAFLPTGTRFLTFGCCLFQVHLRSFSMDGSNHSCKIPLRMTAVAIGKVWCITVSWPKRPRNSRREMAVVYRIGEIDANFMTLLTSLCRSCKSERDNAKNWKIAMRSSRPDRNYEILPRPSSVTFVLQSGQ